MEKYKIVRKAYVLGLIGYAIGALASGRGKVQP